MSSNLNVAIVMQGLRTEVTFIRFSTHTRKARSDQACHLAFFYKSFFMTIICLTIRHFTRKMLLFKLSDRTSAIISKCFEIQETSFVSFSNIFAFGAQYIFGHFSLLAFSDLATLAFDDSAFPEGDFVRQGEKGETLS